MVIKTRAGTLEHMGLASHPDSVTSYHVTLSVLRPEILCAALTSLSLKGPQSSSREFPALIRYAPHPVGWGSLSTPPAAPHLVLNLVVGPPSQQDYSNEPLTSSLRNQEPPHPLVTTKPASQGPSGSLGS